MIQFVGLCFLTRVRLLAVAIKFVGHLMEMVRPIRLGGPAVLKFVVKQFSKQVTMRYTMKTENSNNTALNNIKYNISVFMQVILM